MELEVPDWKQGIRTDYKFEYFHKDQVQQFNPKINFNKNDDKKVN